MLSPRTLEDKEDELVQLKMRVAQLERELHPSPSTASLSAETADTRAPTEQENGPTSATEQAKECSPETQATVSDEKEGDDSSTALDGFGGPVPEFQDAPVDNQHGHPKCCWDIPPTKRLPVPLHKIAAHLRSCTDPHEKYVVIVSSGAYNPIHLMHLRAFYIARQFFEHHTNYRVVGGIVSPCHDTFVRQKTRSFPKQMITRKHRLGMCRVSVQGSSWIAVDRWEITRRRVMDYLSTLKHVEENLEKFFPKIEFRVVYLCGGNHLLTLSPKAMREEGFGCIAVCRPGQVDELLRQVPQAWTGIAHVVEDTAVLSRELELSSSTRVRNELIQGRDVSEKVGVAVEKYLEQNKIMEKIAGRMKWTEEDKKWLSADAAYQEATINEAPPKLKGKPPSRGVGIGHAMQKRDTLGAAGRRVMEATEIS